MEKIILGTSEHYCDNNGNFSLAYQWLESEQKVRVIHYANSHDGLHHNHYKTNATQDQIVKARSTWCKQPTDLRGFLGAICTLKRSKKAPNSTPLLIENISQGGYNERYGNYESDQVYVTNAGFKGAWVSLNCVNELITTKAPF